MVSERSGARRRALVCSGKSAIYIGQAGFAPSGLIRSGALAITIAATIFGQTADAQDLNAVKRCLPATVLRVMQSAEPETAHKNLLRRSVALANAIQSNLWRKRLERASCPVIRTCPNFHSMRRTLVQLLLI